MSKNKKKLGYNQYEELLARAHQKIEFLASKFQEMQSYFIAYVEFNGHNVEFNGWMNDRIKEMKKELDNKKSTSQEPQQERSTVSEEIR